MAVGRRARSATSPSTAIASPRSAAAPPRDGASSAPMGWWSAPDSSTRTRTTTHRSVGIPPSRHRAGTASPASSWATAASPSRRAVRRAATGSCACSSASREPSALRAGIAWNWRRSEYLDAVGAASALNVAAWWALGAALLRARRRQRSGLRRSMRWRDRNRCAPAGAGALGFLHVTGADAFRRRRRPVPAPLRRRRRGARCQVLASSGAARSGHHQASDRRVGRHQRHAARPAGQLPGAIRPEATNSCSAPRAVVPDA